MFFPAVLNDEKVIIAVSSDPTKPDGYVFKPLVIDLREDTVKPLSPSTEIQVAKSLLKDGESIFNEAIICTANKRRKK